jgi:hypothetical protein
MGNSYNGYSWAERMAKFREMERRLASGELAPPRGPCQLCGDLGGHKTSVTFEYHDEDYSQKYSWAVPAAYVVCRDCHIYRLHQRFAHPKSWLLFLAHVRRGGYAREMKEASVKRELAKYRQALDSGAPLPSLATKRPYRHIVGREWFARLSLGLASMSESSSRPRS